MPFFPNSSSRAQPTRTVHVISYERQLTYQTTPEILDALHDWLKLADACTKGYTHRSGLRSKEARPSHPVFVESGDDKRMYFLSEEDLELVYDLFADVHGEARPSERAAGLIGETDIDTFARSWALRMARAPS